MIYLESECIRTIPILSINKVQYFNLFRPVVENIKQFLKYKHCTVQAAVIYSRISSPAFFTYKGV